jgi:cytochrome c biogenesis protein ResB
MDDPFRSWWYRLLLAVLCLSLFACILARTPEVWRVWSKPVPQDAAWLRSVRHGIVRIVRASREGVSRRLASGWSWRTKRDDLWIGERGRIGMWGPLTTHVGLLLLGIGALVSSFGALTVRQGGYAGDLIETAGMPFTVRIDSFRVVYYPLQPGQWVLVNNQWIGRLVRQQPDGLWQVRAMGEQDQSGEMTAVPAAHIRNRFSNEIDRGNIQRYVSWVTVLENGREVKRQEIAVNSPLRYAGFRLYQSSYEPDKPRIAAFYESLRLAASDSAAGRFDTLDLKPGVEVGVPGDTLRVTAGELLPHFKLGQDGPYSESAQFINPAVRLRFAGPNGFEKSKWVFLKFPSHESGPGRYEYRLASLSGTRTSEELMTILEIKRARGGWILWLGFIAATIGLLLSFYVSYRVLYVEWSADGTVRLTGLTRKTVHLYARDLDHLLRGLGPMESS